MRPAGCIWRFTSDLLLFLGMLVVGHVLRPADDLAFVGDIGNFHGFHGHFLHELGLHELLGVFLVMLVVFVLMGRMPSRSARLRR